MKTLLIVSTLILAAAASTAGAAIRLHVPVHVNGPGEIKVGRLIREHHRIDLERFVLKAVIVNPRRRANGYTYLRVGRYRSPTAHVHGRDRRVRIEAPHKGRGNWRLFVSKGTKLRSIVAVLEPRNAAPVRYPHYLPRDTVIDLGLSRHEPGWRPAKYRGKVVTRSLRH